MLNSIENVLKTIRSAKYGMICKFVYLFKFNFSTKYVFLEVGHVVLSVAATTTKSSLHSRLYFMKKRAVKNMNFFVTASQSVSYIFISAFL